MQGRNSTWEVAVTSAAVVAKQTKKDLLGLHAAQASLESLTAEVIRVSLWAQSAYRQASSLSEASVTTQRLLKLARAIWRPVASTYMGNDGIYGVPCDDSSSDPIELEGEILESLAEQGDICEIRSGYWLPAPLRIVRITPTYHLLIGGMPTRSFTPVLHRALNFHGSFRNIGGDVHTALFQDASIPMQWQSLENWLGSVQPLEAFVRYFDELELFPVSHQHVSDTSLDAYDASIHLSQYSRWQSLNRVKNGRYLLRASTPWGINHYTIGFINDHLLTDQSAELRRTDIRRLCYAIDKQAGNPTKARWNQERNVLILHSELPARERKLLSSIGRLIENTNGNYYPRQWHIVQKGTLDVSMLSNLGIQVEAEN